MRTVARLDRYREADVNAAARGIAFGAGKASAVVTEEPTRTGRVAARRGSILVGVLWILVFLAFLAVVLRVHVGSVVTSVRVTEDKAAARIIAEAGLARAAGLVLAGPFTEAKKVDDEIQTSVETSSGMVSVSMTNEAYRIDLNTAEKPLVIGALRAAGASPSLASELAGRIVERRGQANDQGTQPPSANPLQTASEVALIEGMPAEVALALAPITTVSSGLKGVRLLGLSEAVLRDMPDVPSAMIAAIRQYRKGAITRDQLDSLLAGVAINSSEQAKSWRAALKVDLPNGHSEAHEALIMISPEDNVPYRIIDWRKLGGAS